MCLFDISERMVASGPSSSLTHDLRNIAMSGYRDLLLFKS